MFINSLFSLFRQGVMEKIFKKLRFFVTVRVIIPENPQKDTVYNLPILLYNSKIKKYRQIPVCSCAFEGSQI